MELYITLQPPRAPLYQAIGVGQEKTIPLWGSWVCRKRILYEAVAFSRERALIVVGIIDEWRKQAEPFGRRVKVGDVTGRTVNLAEDDRLIVLNDEDSERLSVGGIVESLEVLRQVLVYRFQL